MGAAITLGVPKNQQGAAFSRVGQEYIFSIGMISCVDNHPGADRFEIRLTGDREHPKRWTMMKKT